MSSPYNQVGQRIKQRMLARGYRKADDDGEPDIQRFAWDHRFSTQQLYNWIHEKGTPTKDLIRLCASLDCSADWLLTGHEWGKAMPRQRRGLRSLLLALAVGGALLPWPGGARAAAQPLGVVMPCDEVPLIGSRRRRLGMVAA